MEIKTEVKRVQVLRKAGEKSITAVELINWETKREIMVRKRDLKSGVYIEDDLTRKERVIQNQLREKAREKRREGQRVKIEYMRINIEDKWCKWNEKEEKLEEERNKERRL